MHANHTGRHCTWQFSQHSPCAHWDPSVNLQVWALQHLFLHSCKRNRTLHKSEWLLRKNALFIQNKHKNFKELSERNKSSDSAANSEGCIYSGRKTKEAAHFYCPTVTLLPRVEESIATDGSTINSVWAGVVQQASGVGILQKCTQLIKTAITEQRWEHWGSWAVINNTEKCEVCLLKYNECTHS